MSNPTFIINTDIFSDVFDSVFGRATSRTLTFNPDHTSEEEGIWLNIGNTLQHLAKTHNIEVSAPNYPVSDLSLDAEGNCIMDLAVCGFSKEDISVKRTGDILVITGEKKDPAEGNSNKLQRHYVYKKIAQRNFIVKYRINDKFDIDKMEVSLDKGILTLNVPLKEENKPTEKEYNIN